MVEYFSPATSDSGGEANPQSLALILADEAQENTSSPVIANEQLINELNYLAKYWDLPLLKELKKKSLEFEVAIENFNLRLIKDRLDTCKEDNPESVQPSQET